MLNIPHKDFLRELEEEAQYLDCGCCDFFDLRCGIRDYGQSHGAGMGLENRIFGVHFARVAVSQLERLA